jgi:dephospho-CoA kinase
MKKLIGLTGLYCAGKNYVARLLEERGLPVLDADTLGHRVIETEREAILARFGPEVLGPGGAVDRGLLGRRVFSRGQELAALEAIIHPAVNRLTEAWIAGRGDHPCVINAALLHRCAVFNEFAFIILVRAPFLVRLFRARRRDGLPFGELIRRFRNQGEFTAQYFRGKADIYTVDNRGRSLRFFGEQRRVENRIDAILSQEGIIR